MEAWQIGVLIVTIIGAVNWLLVGLFKFDLVAMLVGRSFGETTALSRLVYLIVGLCGLASISIFWA